MKEYECSADIQKEKTIFTIKHPDVGEQNFTLNIGPPENKERYAMRETIFEIFQLMSAQMLILKHCAADPHKLTNTSNLLMDLITYFKNTTPCQCNTCTNKLQN